MQTVRLGMEQSYCGIQELYDKVAELLGHESVEGLKYDCRKIRVSNNISDNIEAYYRNVKEWSAFDFGAAWLNFGPKCDIDLEDDTVVVEDDFVEVT